MPMVAPSFIESGDKIFWLLDSGSSYHVVSRATLEGGHVKVLSRKKKPKTVCQIATSDLVEVGSDTHATIEVNFLTTRPIEKREGVLSTFACTCRLEAVVSDEIKHNLINLNLLCWKGWRPTLYEGLLTAEQRGITLYPHLYGDCTWLESVVPEHPSATLASVSSHVGRSVGWSDDFSAHEKQHEFSRHEHEFSHEQHDFSQHGHDFSREQHEQTHVEQIQLPHVGGNTLGGSAVGQSSCDSSGVQLVGQSSCGSSEVQLVGRLPARVVELLQSSTVGKPCQDRRLCQDYVGTPLSSGPTTSPGLGPTLGAQGSLRGSVDENEFLQRSACVHGLVGRSVGRSVGRAEESMQLNVAAQLPLKARVGGPGQSRATLGGDGYEGTCKVGATVAACAGDLGARRESSGDRGLGDGKGPSGHDGGSSDGGITPVMEEVWTPPYHAPESTWSIPGPLDHAQTPSFTFCLLCEKWCSAGHLMSAGHSSAMERWMRSGKPLLQIPHRFAEDEQVEMLIQSRHPTWSRRTTLAAKQAILQMAYYRAQEGTFRGEIPPEMDKNLEKVLKEVREHPHQPAVHPAVSDDEAWGNWRASSDLRRPVTSPGAQ